MSPTYFSTYFKTKTGQTFRSYVNSRRNEYAKSLLANITMSIEEISEQLGYTDYRSFHRIFKRMNSITPSEYRKRITKR
jgi:two-component system response regulator YesN